MNDLVQSFYNWYKTTMKHPKYRWVLIVGSLVYLISPIDISPDFIPIIGWVDDAVVASLLVAELSQLFLAMLSGKQADTGADNLDPSQTTVDVNAE
jgi:uncharacterized membrane protein YkvA (DUF1232 family)